MRIEAAMRQARFLHHLGHAHTVRAFGAQGAARDLQDLQAGLFFVGLAVTHLAVLGYPII